MPEDGRRRILVIVNPHATTVSDRLKNLVIYALQSRFEVEVEATQGQNHATEIGRGARDGAWEMVVAFGGDGTINEVANGLAGTEIPLGLLPGGNTNVVCRTLGIPNDVVEATEHLLSLADDLRTTRVALGRVGDRHFVFSCGCGIDATVVEKVDANPGLKSTAGPWYYSWSALSGYMRSYMRDPVMLEVATPEKSIEGVTVLAQNSDPFTFFGSRAVHVCPPVAMADPFLSMSVLKRGNQLDAATLIPRLLSSRLDAGRHGQMETFDRLTEATVRSLSTEADGTVRTFPVQVDGDFIGRFEEVDISIVPDALSIVA
jgi:diacylglycerol kinase family enzyme